jgi:hypothetical protein
LLEEDGRKQAGRAPSHPLLLLRPGYVEPLAELVLADLAELPIRRPSRIPAPVRRSARSMSLARISGTIG